MMANPPQMLVPVINGLGPAVSTGPDWLTGLMDAQDAGADSCGVRSISRDMEDSEPGVGEEAPVAAALPVQAIKADIDALPRRQRLVEHGQFQVYCARADQIGRVLQEIGRLREITYRAAGEGTGRCTDIDVYDSYYLHLFVWDARAQAIVGAYRLGLADRIVARYGMRALYTQSLFRYDQGALACLDPAIELGRSFVRTEYQRDYAPLLLLWRGIARLIQDSPRYAVLFGPVSISSHYEPGSLQLMVDYLTANNADDALARQVHPRRPFRRQSPAGTIATALEAKSLDDLSRLVAEMEPDRKGVPILLRQYLRLGGRLLGFSVDHRFRNTLDGLIVVDLRKTLPQVLARYMGKSGSAAFYAYHDIDASSARRDAHNAVSAQA